MRKSKKADTEKAGKPKKAEKPVKEKKSVSKKTPAPKAEKSVKPVKVPAKPAAVKPRKTVAPAPVISLDEISLRAYFISERRQAMGWPGDPTSDWVEAELQLKAESSKKAKR